MLAAEKFRATESSSRPLFMNLDVHHLVHKNLLLISVERLPVIILFEHLCELLPSTPVSSRLSFSYSYLLPVLYVFLISSSRATCSSQHVV